MALALGPLVGVNIEDRVRGDDGGTHSASGIPVCIELAKEMVVQGDDIRV